MLVNFHLKAKTSLIMHKDDVEEADVVKEAREKIKKGEKKGESKESFVAADDRCPAWTWTSYLYHDGATISMPCENLMTCLRAAATKMLMPKAGRGPAKSFKDVSQSGMYITQEFLPIMVGGKQVPVEKFMATRSKSISFADHKKMAEEHGINLFVKRVRVGQTKHVRVRPRFDSWEISGNIEITSPQISLDNLKEMFALAENVGLGDWRPSSGKPGAFGMFEATVKKA